MMKIPAWRILTTGSILFFILALVITGDVLIYVRHHAGHLLERYAARQGVPIKIGRVRWFGWRSAELDDVEIGTQGRAVTVGKIVARWKWRHLLLHKRVSYVLIDKPKVWTGSLEELVHSLKKEFPSPSAPVKPYVIDHVVMRSGILNLDNLRIGVPSIAVEFGGDQPIEFWNLPLGAGPSEQENWPQSAVAQNVQISSPYDPLVKVLNFESIRLTFTWAGLAESKIDHLELIAPSVYLGPDLFWFINQVRSGSTTKAAANVVVDTPVWWINQLDLRGGRLIISAFGDSGVELPFLFASNATHLRLDRIEDLSLNNEIKILPTPIEYPEYNISLEPKGGSIKFNLPPGQNNANNLVPTIYFQRVRWRDIEATNAWASFTFDEHGISGDLGGESYGGYLNGKFNIAFGVGYPWKAWGYMTNVDTQPVVQKLTENRFEMELAGRASGKIEVSAQSTNIKETSVALHLVPPGSLRIKEIDRLMQNLPQRWSGFQKDAADIALGSFENYSYSSAEVTARYGFPESEAKLELYGESGHRTINLKWDQDPKQPPLMKSIRDTSTP